MRSLIGKLFIHFFTWLLCQFSPKALSSIFALIIRSISKASKPKRALQFLFSLENEIYLLEGSAAQEYGNGIHTKIRHLNYPVFFAKYIRQGEQVLDIGCGNGAIDYALSKIVRNIRITGIDIHKGNITNAKEKFSSPQITYIHGDAFKNIPKDQFDIVILSNVLEHFKNRTLFLKKVIKLIKPKRLLIRVPLFERDWRVPLKKEIGIESRLDPTHFTEYTIETFQDEMKKSGLIIDHKEVRWGEIWSVVHPK